MQRDFRFGITEQGDAGIDLSWQKRLDSVIGAIIISKSNSLELMNALLKNKDKCIYHATCTGLGGTLIQPNVPSYKQKLQHIWKLIDQGFPRKQIIIRIDPLMPFDWVQTLNKYLNIDYISILTDILKFAETYNIETVRYSYLDLYDSTINRLSKLPFKFPTNGLSISNQIRLWDINPKLKYRACAQKNVPKDQKVGCISIQDLQKLGVQNKYQFVGSSMQRYSCLCPKQKLELLNHDHQCQHKCVYCYWKDKKSGKN